MQENQQRCNIWCEGGGQDQGKTQGEYRESGVQGILGEEQNKNVKKDTDHRLFLRSTGLCSVSRVRTLGSSIYAGQRSLECTQLDIASNSHQPDRNSVCLSGHQCLKGQITLGSPMQKDLIQGSFHVVQSNKSLPHRRFEFALYSLTKGLCSQILVCGGKLVYYLLSHKRLQAYWRDQCKGLSSKKDTKITNMIHGSWKERG